MDSCLLISIISTGITLISIGFGVVSWHYRPEELKLRFGRKKNNPKPFTYKDDDFAHDTIRYRFRNILHELNNYYEDAVTKIYKGEELREMIQKRPFSYDTCMEKRFEKPEVLMKKLSKDDQIELEKVYKQYPSNDRTNKAVFREAPFIDSEHFFYYYILNVFYGLPIEIQEYMSDGHRDVMDPYKLKKKKSIEDDVKGVKSYILDCLNIIGSFKNKYNQEALRNVVRLSLDTNSCDLSQLGGKTIHPLPEENIYPSERVAFVEYFDKESGKGSEDTDPKIVVNYLVDNGSVEFFSDLTFAFVVLNMANVKEVNFYVNKLPIFVSDVVEDDFTYMVETIKRCLDNLQVEDAKKAEYCSCLAKLEELVNMKRINIKPGFIWNMPTEYRALANDGCDLFRQQNSVLVIKGDLNYRRLAGDKMWSYKKRLSKITQDFLECPTLVIRSFKSDLVLDYSFSRYRKNNKNDDNRYWRENGEYGVIRFLPPRYTSARRQSADVSSMA